MTDGDVYKIVELVGTSKTSWEDAVKTVVDRATKSLRDLRIAEVKELDVRLENGKIAEYRAKVRLSFKYEGDRFSSLKNSAKAGLIWKRRSHLEFLCHSQGWP